MQNLNSLGSTFMNEMNSPASKAARYEANQRDNIRRIHEMNRAIRNGTLKSRGGPRKIVKRQPRKRQSRKRKLLDIFS